MVLPMPVPASASTTCGSPARSRGAKAALARAAKATCPGRASASAPASSASLASASASPTGSEPAGGRGARSSHSGNSFQMSKPRAPDNFPSRPEAAGSASRSAATTPGPHAHPASAIRRAVRAAKCRPGRRGSCSCLSMAAAASRSIIAWSSGVSPGSRPSARARPPAVGRHGCAGYEKAKSSRRSSTRGPASRKARPLAIRRAVKPACTSMTGACSIILSASAAESSSISPSAETAIAPPAAPRAGTSAIASGSMGSDLEEGESKGGLPDIAAQYSEPSCETYCRKIPSGGKARIGICQCAPGGGDLLLQAGDGMHGGVGLALSEGHVNIARHKGDGRKADIRCRRSHFAGMR